MAKKTKNKRIKESLLALDLGFPIDITNKNTEDICKLIGQNCNFSADAENTGVKVVIHAFTRKSFTLVCNSYSGQTNIDITENDVVELIIEFNPGEGANVDFTLLNKDTHIRTRLCSRFDERIRTFNQFDNFTKHIRIYIEDGYKDL